MSAVQEPETSAAAKPRFRCPQCKSEDGLWQGVEVPGWRSVASDLTPIDGSSERGTDWTHVLTTGEYGCGECGWEGHRQSLEPADADDEPLPTVHPDQQTLV